ncbi:CLUMA_CG015593, isoform A [Clunio marinus]|uniref:CLUMA_CG015593, isoform A n=1 Tax=Clunio marinus TaxID=568069 RepID=A0A1J1IQD1_9DIPT|nr:CLUMA_CG015593, isoform A [Clunio marinus]
MKKFNLEKLREKAINWAIITELITNQQYIKYESQLEGVISSVKHFLITYIFCTPSTAELQ